VGITVEFVCKRSLLSKRRQIIIPPTKNMYSFRCKSASAISGTRWRHYQTTLFNGVILATSQVCRELIPFVLSSGGYTTGNRENIYLTKRSHSESRFQKSFKILSTNINICTKPSNYLTVTAKETAIRADSQRKLKGE
jgi:hypothetical protein